MKWNKISEKRPRQNKLFLLIYQNNLMTGIFYDDIYYLGANKVKYNKEYILECVEFGNPLFEYWMYFPYKGLPKEGITINIFGGDEVVSREEVRSDQVIHTKGDEWIERAIRLGQMSGRKQNEQHP